MSVYYTRVCLQPLLKARGTDGQIAKWDRKTKRGIEQQQPQLLGPAWSLAPGWLAGYICLFVCRSSGIPRWSDFYFYSSFSLFHQVFHLLVRFVLLVSWGFAYIFFYLSRHIVYLFVFAYCTFLSSFLCFATG
ncbi:hypothetical protein B9Z19DRAFT_845338 [Tuber borchii]|uniref:Uncharacterized protein n=1 Tax=Tuber borchii TaxID=42251 RepID=A0A2T6ZUP3_TUBBO|nr:hypothetical protein B9Z19DRAFT_845338 [Tuber borchii]